MYVSADVRRVLAWLADREIGVNESQLIWLELTCSFFFPNHIQTVINQILSGGNEDAKLAKARKLGWEYFNKPCYDLLCKRIEARRHKSVGGVTAGPGLYGPTPTQLTWWTRCQQRLLVRDMDRGEADIILFELSSLDPELLNFREAVRVCKERDIRSPRYLMGILNREIQEKQGKATERDREQETEQPWEPPSGYRLISTVERARLQILWEEHEENIEIMKMLRKHGS